MMFSKFIALFLVLVMIPSIIGIPVFVHHCCGEIESISLGIDGEQDQEECCENVIIESAYTVPNCCLDEAVFLEALAESLPISQSIFAINHLVDSHSFSSIKLDKSIVIQASIVVIRKSLSIFLNKDNPPELLCMFRI